MFASKTLSSVVLTMVQSPSKSGIALSTSSYVFKRCFPPFTFREQIPLEFKVLYKQKKFISWKKKSQKEVNRKKKYGRFNLYGYLWINILYVFLNISLSKKKNTCAYECVYKVVKMVTIVLKHGLFSGSVFQQSPINV